MAAACFLPHVELMTAVPMITSTYVRYVVHMLAFGDQPLRGLRMGETMQFVRCAAGSDPDATKEAAVLHASRLADAPLIVPSLAVLSAAQTVGYSQYIAFPNVLAQIVHILVLLWCGEQYAVETALGAALRRVVAKPFRSRQARCLLVAKALRDPAVVIQKQADRPHQRRTEWVNLDAGERADVVRHAGFLVRHGALQCSPGGTELQLLANPRTVLGKRKQDKNEDGVHGRGVQGRGAAASKKRLVSVEDRHHSSSDDSDNEHPAADEVETEQ
jgi:hypothetical protein